MSDRKTRKRFAGVVVVAGAVVILGIVFPGVRQQSQDSVRKGESGSADEVSSLLDNALDDSSASGRKEENDGATEIVAVTMFGQSPNEVRSKRDWDAESIREQFGLEKKGDVWLPAITIANGSVSSGIDRNKNSAGGAAGENDGVTPLYLTTGALPSGVEGESYRVSLDAVGGSLPYRWDIAEGALPGGLELDPIEGIISGTCSDPGTFRFRIQVVDAGERSDIASYTIIVEESGALRILTETLLEGKVGEDYSGILIATGGAEPYTWAMESVLPSGVTLADSGSLDGEPEVEGSFRFRVRVTDAGGANATGTVKWTVSGDEQKGVTNFEALLSLRRVALSWTPPVGVDTPAVRIVRNEQGFPGDPDDGVTVFSGVESQMIDRGLDAGRYYYGAFVEGASAEEVPPARLVLDLSSNRDPFADSVVESSPLSAAAFQANLLPGVVTGAPRGGGVTQGSLHVTSLGAAQNDDGGVSSPYGGSIILEFTDNGVWDGPGADFTVFENVFYLLDSRGNPDPDSRFMEPAVVSVSQDGTRFVPFPFNFSPRFDPETGGVNLRHPFIYNSGFAGVNPTLSNGYDPDPSDPAVSGGDSFDIGELGFEWIRFVRIQSTGHRWLVDRDGDLVLHSEEVGSALRGSPGSGFDLDAVGAVWVEKVRQEP